MAETTLPDASDASAGRTTGALPLLPPDALIIVPVRSTVLFPGIMLPITIGRQRSIAAAQQAVRDQRQVGVLMQRRLRNGGSGTDRHASDGYGR